MTIITADLGPVTGWKTDVCCARLTGATEEQQILYVTAAAEILYDLSGRQFGLVSGEWFRDEDSPCHQACVPGLVTGYPWTPMRLGRDWINCGCGCECKIHLPAPVDCVTQVVVDGDVVPSSDYWVENRENLVLASGGCVVDSVKYVRGTPLPRAGSIALGEFACEIAKACLGDDDCCLNSRVTSITRQGVTMNMIDPLEFIEKGRTGMYVVDAWLQAVNPKGKRRRAGIYSPDLDTQKIVTWNA